MPTTRETILAALHARLQPLAALVLRDEVLPERIPTSGLIILRDGQPGEPEVTLSPLRYHFQHRAELEVVVQAGTGRASAFDTLITAIGTALESDRMDREDILNLYVTYNIPLPEKALPKLDALPDEIPF